MTPGRLVYEVRYSDGSVETYDLPDSRLGRALARFMLWFDARGMKKRAAREGARVITMDYPPRGGDS